MRFKRVPLRAPGGISEDPSNEETPINDMSDEQKPLRVIQTHLLQDSVSPIVKGILPLQGHQSGGPYSKDEETQAAQAKLRQYEALGLIKVEVDEPGEDEPSHEGTPERHTMHPQALAHSVSSSQSPNTYQTGNFTLQGVPVYAQLVQAAPLQMTQQQQVISGTALQKGGGLFDLPALTDMKGEYGFSVSVEEKERTTKSPMWLMSKVTKKLYTNINKAVPFDIHFEKKIPRNQCHVRAVAVFSSAQFLRTNVTRCPNHASTADITNHDFPYPAHVVRADHPEAQYEESSNGRLSVVVPLDILQDGTEYTPILLRFMCLGSCVGGINRRPIAIILTLENNAGQVFGRKVIDVRVCACPTRDIRTDEQAVLNKGLKRRGYTQEKSLAPIRKKPKSVEPKSEPQDDDQIYYIPVRGQKLYNFMLMMKESYYKTHPEYAAKYPDSRLQNDDDDSEDDLRGNGIQGLDITDSEAPWDSGGNYSHQDVYSKDTHRDISNGQKNNSPLSKLTPNISISPSPVSLRLFHDDIVNEIANCTQAESVQLPTNAQPGDIIYTNIKSVGNTHDTVNSDSVPISKSSMLSKQGNNSIDNTPKHIPVMQVQSYKPGSVTLKAKSMAVPKRNLHNSFGGDKGKRSPKKKNRHETVNHPPLVEEDSSGGMYYEQSINEEYSMSPGSPEMLAANVLVEGFKSKAMIHKQQ